MNKIKLDFNNSISSEVDEIVYKYILKLQELNKSPKPLPPFFHLSNLIKKYSPKVVTVEHNFTNNEKLDNLFKENNYIRFFSDQSQFDAWYVRND
tara:strand:+ start:2942 stop:3226 length:285 start_codon:yes stop_codon:yes gene_type:complete